MGNTELKNTADEWKINLVFPEQLKNLSHTFLELLSSLEDIKMNKITLFFTA